MNKIILLFFSIYLSCIAFGQNLTLDQVISLHHKPLAKAEEYLTQKNWELIRAEEPGGIMMGTTVFSYGKSLDSDKATSFLTFRYGSTESSKIETLYLQINTTKAYKAYIARLNSLGYKIIKTKVEDGSIKKLYRGKTFTITVTSKTEKYEYSTSNIYTFFIYTTKGNSDSL